MKAKTVFVRNGGGGFLEFTDRDDRFGAEYILAEQAEAQKAEAVRECEQIAYDFKFPVGVGIVTAIRNRWPEYFKEG